MTFSYLKIYDIVSPARIWTAVESGLPSRT